MYSLHEILEAVPKRMGVFSRLNEAFILNQYQLLESDLNMLVQGTDKSWPNITSLDNIVVVDLSTSLTCSLGLCTLIYAHHGKGVKQSNKTSPGCERYNFRDYLMTERSECR